MEAPQAGFGVRCFTRARRGRASFPVLSICSTETRTTKGPAMGSAPLILPALAHSKQTDNAVVLSMGCAGGGNPAHTCVSVHTHTHTMASKPWPLSFRLARVLPEIVMLQLASVLSPPLAPSHHVCGSANPCSLEHSRKALPKDNLAGTDGKVTRLRSQMRQ